MDPREDDDYFGQETEYQEQSEFDEWKEIDDARRYREYQSDNRRPY